ncbi:MAG TPA: hypothetical protein VJQ46_13805 [Gemmatimonadales bacterium]|nr:hypothetical protein [Gemmatimonadales bacterium]
MRFAVLSVPLLAGCQSTGPIKHPLAIEPRCTLLCAVWTTNETAWNGQVFVSERLDPSVPHGFTAFRPMAGPRGSTDVNVYGSSVTGFKDTYGISEAWLRSPGAHEVYRGQATPAYRNVSTGQDYHGSSWNIFRQLGDGVWFQKSSNATDTQIDDPDAAAGRVPQFMPVGQNSPTMFACAGGYTADGAERTTILIDATPTTGATFVQDVLNGDDRGYRDANGQPTSNILPLASGPGDPIRKGVVYCAMTQQGEDVSTRELHMVAIQNGVLYHAMASNFSPVATFQGMSRFHTMSKWGNVGAVLGGNFGTITSVAIVAYPRAIGVFFVAQLGGVYRLWHTVRFSADGTWRPAKDVLLLSGDAPVGRTAPFFVSAGLCPEMGAAQWDDSNTETLLAVWSGPMPMTVGVVRVVTTSRTWTPTVTGFYSPLQMVPLGGMSDPQYWLRGVAVSARPFRDDAFSP